jgi:putative DNA-invertase from lambdoid prophage Rac
MTSYGYARTSMGNDRGQDGAGQIHRLLEAGIPRDHIILDDGQSGMKAATDRPEFARLLAMLKPGDTVTTPELSRIGRSVRDVLGTIDSFESSGITLKILDLGLDLSTPVGRMVATVLAAIGRLERDFISERTKAELAARKAAGVKLGAKPKLTPTQAASVATMKSAGMSPKQIGAALGISERSVYNYLAPTLTQAQAEQIPGLLKAGLDLPQIGRALGVPRAAVQPYVRTLETADAG